MRVPQFVVSVLSIAFVAISSSLVAEIDNEADAVLERAVADHEIPAISAGIAVDGEIVWTGAAGWLNLERQVPATAESVYRIASISKVMTAVAAMALAEKQTIAFDAPVQRYLGDYPEPKKGTMRVIDLLAHTSGIRHYKGNESRSSAHYHSLRDACRVFEGRKLAFTPGTAYRYTSYGYTVLGAVIESATRKPFRSTMRELVWEPAGMAHTDLEIRPGGFGTSEGVATLYRKDGSKIVRDVENDLSLIYPGGGMLSTAGDLLRFVIALEEERLVSSDSVERMLEPPIYRGKVLDENAGLGWNVWEHEKHGTVYHRVGGQSGASALLISYRDRGVTVALLTNLARLDPIWTITNELIGIGLSAGK